MSEGLTRKTLRGLFWSFLERGGHQFIQLIASIILARLLLPEDFGLIAILLVFIAIANNLVDSGFGSALIQKQNTTHIDECSVFYFNILLSVLVAAMLNLIAPFIADFYGNPILAPLCRVLSLNIIFGAFSVVHVAILTKRVDFKTQSKVSILAALLSGVIGITMAYRGFGVWSLIAQTVIATLIRTILVWILHDWRPTWIFSYASLRRMFPFGSRLMLSGLLDSIFSNIFPLIIGKLFSPRDVGFFTQADQLQRFPATNLTTIVSRVTFPIFSLVQIDKVRLKKGVRKTLMALALVNFPVMIGLAVVAKPLILVLLTDKWLPSVAYLQILCVFGLLYPLHAINLNALKAQGRSDLFLRLEILKKLLFIVSIAITYRWGIMAMIYGSIAVSFIGYYLNSYYSGKFFDYSTVEQIRDFFPSLSVACLMGYFVHLLNYVPFPNQLTLLVSQVVVGAGIYLLLCRLFRLEAFMDALITFVPKRPVRRRDEKI